MKFRLLSRRSPPEVAELREDIEDLRAEVAALRQQLRALQEREAVLNARVLHLGRYTSGGNGAAAPIANGGQQEAATGRQDAAACLEAFGGEKGAAQT